MRYLTAVCLFFCFFHAPVSAAAGVPDLPNMRFVLRDSPYAPSIRLAERDISADLYKFVSGGWGFTRDAPCVLKIPNASEGRLLSIFLTKMQEAMACFRYTTQSVAGSGKAGIALAKAEPPARKLYYAPGERIFEHMKYTLTVAPADKAGESKAAEEKGRTGSDMPPPAPLDMWFDTTDFILHNASILWKISPEETRDVFFPENTPDSNGSAKAGPRYAGVFAEMPAPADTSVYLMIAPERLFRSHPALSAYPGRVSGDWGYEKSSPLVVKAENGANDTAPPDKVVDAAFEFRSVLEYAHPRSAEERLYPVLMDRKKEEGTDQGEAEPGAVTYTLYLADEEQYREFVTLHEKGDTTAIETELKPKLQRKEDSMYVEIAPDAR